MANAYRDENDVPTLIASSNVDGQTPVRVYADPVTHRLLVDSASGGTGTVTQINTGTGLTGGPITTTGTISLDSKLAPLDTLGTAGQAVRVNAGATALEYFTLGGGTGTVTTVSVVSANGLAGTVANATTTPAITLSTTVTGILKGDGTTISAASAGTDYVTASSTNTFTNKTYDTAGTGNSFSINGVAATANTGTGAVARAAGPTFTTPTLGVAAATTINKVTITAPATGSTLTIADGKTLTQSNTLTYTGTDGSSVAFGTGGTVLYANQSITLTGDVTGSGSTSIATTVAKITGTVVSGTTGSVNVVFSTSPTLTTPTLGVATATSINKMAITAPATSSTLAVADGKTFTASNTMTLAAGADSQTFTFPATTATIAGLGTTQTFTGQDKFNNFIDVNNAVTVTSNAGTVPITFRLNTFTNSSAATMAITLATSSAVDGQMSIVRIYDFSGVAQTIGWTNTENSTVSVPLTSNGSTTLPLTVGFMFNGATSKWRCIASA